MVSIKPKYADKILEGEKTVELRKKFPREVAVGGIAVIYTSSPVKAITGFFRISAVQRLTIKQLWEEFGEAACIEESDFFSYFENSEFGYAIHVENPQKLDKHISIDSLRRWFDFTPPQSFRYLAEDLGAYLQNERVQISY